jgi:FkbM family methyltransferase
MGHPAVAAAAAALTGITEPVVIELGCNHGMMTREIWNQIFASRGGHGQLLAVEPDKRAIDRGQGTYPPGVEPTWGALSDRDGLVDLHMAQAVGDRGHGSSTICKPLPSLSAEGMFPWLKFPDVMTVPCMTLDTFCQQARVGAIDLLWADIEGSEARLIAGAKKMLPRTRLIYLETWKSKIFEGQLPEDELLAKLPGWEIIYTEPSHALLRNPSFSYPVQS